MSEKKEPGFRTDHDPASKVARIVLSSPPLNVLTTSLARSLAQEIERLAASPSHRLLALAAEGKAFSAGASVEEHLPGSQVDAMLEAMASLVRALEQHPRPVVALVRGACLGGGFEVALACDLIYSSDRAAFGCPEIKLGVFAPFASALLPRRVGFGRALELLLLGEALSASEAHARGVVERVFPDETFDAESRAALARIAERSGPALGVARRAVRESLAERSLFVALEAMRARYKRDVSGLADAEEGCRAFLEKRAPAWRDC
ncbi:enoyl-CoA hydratase/isomerase family protein [bacterium]|nr:enoyl-CoA hydratase/isomerase family protein [bacterium]